MTTERFTWLRMTEQVRSDDVVRVLNTQLPKAGRMLAALQPRPLFTVGGLSTSATVQASVTACVVTANTLRTDGDGLRITIHGYASGASCAFTANFGASAILNGVVGPGVSFMEMLYIVRTGPTTQVSRDIPTDASLVSMGRVACTETLNEDVTIDFLANVQAGQTGTFAVDAIVIEPLSAVVA